MVSYPRGGMIVRRNDRCPCGSGQKFKFCCSPDAATTRRHKVPPRPQFIDSGETPVRWVICDESGTRFFADKDNRALVFSDQAAAIAIARLEDFADQAPGEINVAGVGQTKFELLKEKLPFVEVDAESALTLVRERIRYGREKATTPDVEPAEVPASSDAGTAQ